MSKIINFFIGALVLCAVIICIFRVGCMIYPKQYKVYVSAYSTEYGISEDLVYSIIKAESNYDRKAVSKKGAIGLMQITEETGLWVSEKIKLADFSKEKLYDPKTNIEIGCFYLSYLLDLYGGNEKNALAAYNAGPTNVNKWILDKNCSKDGENLDNIPFKETKEYVKKVASNVKKYKFLY